ncbi:MAG: ankyrin repeat domain-containing protein [Armatimonas sp.]
MRKPPVTKSAPETPAQRQIRLNTLLLQSAEKQDTAQVQALLRAGASVKARDVKGCTPLLRALHGPPSTGDRMQDLKQELALVSPNRVAPTIQLLLNAGSEVNATDNEGYSPLLLSMGSLSVSLCRELLKRKANPNLANKEGMTPLGMAAMTRSPVLIELLLSYGADPKRGSYPVLGLAALGMPSSLFDEDDEDITKLDPLKLLLRQTRNAEDDYSQAMAAMTMLLKAGADPNGNAPDFSTPLHVAAEYSGPPVLSYLLKAGSKVNTVSKSGETALHTAILAGRWDNVRILLDARADPNTVREEGGLSPLHSAVEMGSYACVERLLTAGAHRDIHSRAGQTPLDLARARHMTALVGLLTPKSP